MLDEVEKKYRYSMMRWLVGIVLSKSQIISTESGENENYSITLNAEPSADVTVTLSKDTSDTTLVLSTTSIVFTVLNWNTPVDITLSLPGDSLTESILTTTISHAVSSTDLAYASTTNFVPQSSVQVTIYDDDQASVILSSGYFYLLEGTSSLYGVVLSSQPSASVTVTITTSARLSMSSSSVVFESSDWNTEQFITVTAIEDAIARVGTDDQSITYAVSSTDPNFQVAHILPTTVSTVSVLDKTHAGISISRSFVALSDAQVATYSIELMSEPTQDVTLSLSEDPASGNILDLNVTSVVFTAANWHTRQWIQLTADGSGMPAPLEVILNHDSSSTDPMYDASDVAFYPADNVRLTVHPSCVLSCAAGYYALSGACASCIVGHVCPGGCAGFVACPKGTYNSNSLAQDLASACVSCPSGQFAAQLGSASCAVCPAGSKCPDAAEDPVACAAGTYAAVNALTCSDCMPGYACASPDTSPVACLSGYYALARSTACSACPAGKKCPSTSAEPEDCEVGTYSLGSATACTDCPAGSFCFFQNILPIPCSSEGFYSPPKSQYCFTCPAGFSCPSPSADPVPCADGQYSADSNSICNRTCMFSQIWPRPSHHTNLYCFGHVNL